NAFLHTRIPAAFQINQLVADHVALRKVDAEFISRIEKKLRRWFAPTTWRIGMFWRNVDFLEFYSVRCKFVDQTRVNFFHIRQSEIAASHARLIRDQKQSETGILQFLQSRYCTREQHNLFRLVKIFFV